MKLPANGVAFFDSGIGGLTVMRACRERLPDEIFYYYGDNERAPYGNLPKEVLRSYITEAFTLFSSLCVKAVVLACNTVTACFAEELRAKYPFLIVGAEPAVLTGAKEGGNVLVLTTVATRQSERFQALCKKACLQYPNAKIFPIACPTLAGEIERAITQDEQREYSSVLPLIKADAVVLGCTHYIYIKKEIQDFYGCKTCDGNKGIAERLNFLLRRKNGKGRDGQPLITQTCCAENLNEQKPNKNSFFCENSSKIATKNTYFLGKSQKINKKIYEQMFVL